MAPADPHTPVSPDSARASVQQVMGATQAMLQKVLLEEIKAQAGEISLPEPQKQYSIYPHFPQETADIQQSVLSGFCSHAQSFAAWTLQDMGQKPGCFAFQNQPSPGTPATGKEATHNHVALTVSIETTAGPKTYLLDPTFRQFFNSPDSPGSVLAQQQGGEKLAKELQEKGYAEISKADAALYVSAFHGGKSPFASADEAMKFLTNPEDPRLKHGLWPPKSFLAEKGWYTAPASDDYGRDAAAAPATSAPAAPASPLIRAKAQLGFRPA